MGSQQIWCGKEKSCYKAKSSKTKARRQQEELRWEWQVSRAPVRVAGEQQCNSTHCK